MDTRLAWLAAALNVDPKNGKLELEARPEPEGAAPYWSVVTSDGRTLWRSGTLPDSQAVVTRSRVLHFGDPAWPEQSGNDLLEGESSLDKVPAAVKEAAHQAIAGLVLDEAVKSRKRSRAVYTFEGAAHGLEYEIKVADDGSVLSIKENSDPQFGEYRLSKSKRRLELHLLAADSAERMQQDSDHLAHSLSTVGPLALLITALLLSLVIRWQLRPLAHLAREASLIGPHNVGRPILARGTSAEYRRLRQAINAMLQRLAEGLERERQFASTANCWLQLLATCWRTPAVMRPDSRQPDESRCNEIAWIWSSPIAVPALGQRTENVFSSR